MTQIKEGDKLIVITRKDLSTGLQAAQAGHSIVEFCLRYPEITREWRDNSNYIVILAANNENDLVSIIKKAEAREIRHTYFSEPDLDNQITAVVLEPGLDSRKLSSSIKLAGSIRNNGM